MPLEETKSDNLVPLTDIFPKENFELASSERKKQRCAESAYHVWIGR